MHILTAVTPDSVPTANPLGWVPAAVAVLVIIGSIVGLAIFSRRKKKKDAEAAEIAALTRHHTPRWSGGDYRSFRAEPRHWGLAVAAPFALCGDEPWDVVRYKDAPEVRVAIAEAWGIQSRRTMVSTLYDLLVAGHREQYTYEISQWTAMDAAEAASYEKRLRADARLSDAGAETLWRFRRVRANDRGIQQADFLAWDFVRAAMLARAGATTGFLSEAEAEDFLLMIADDLRAHYSSWEELGESFLLGRWFWNSQGGEGERSMDLHDRNRQQVLLGVDGPWRAVPWQMRGPASRMLFADALAEDLSVLAYEPERFSGEGARWAARLRSEVRTRVEASGAE